MIVGSFGPVVFMVSSEVVRTFSSGSRERSTNFHTHQVIGRAPRLEAGDPGLDRVNLEIKLDHSLGTSPAYELAALNELMQLQETWPLILGPVPIGEYVLIQIEEEWSRFTGSGALAAASVKLSLLQDSEAPWAGRVSNAISN